MVNNSCGNCNGTGRIDRMTACKICMATGYIGPRPKFTFKFESKESSTGFLFVEADSTGEAENYFRNTGRKVYSPSTITKNQ